MIQIKLQNMRNFSIKIVKTEVTVHIDFEQAN